MYTVTKAPYSEKAFLSSSCSVSKRLRWPVKENGSSTAALKVTNNTKSLSPSDPHNHTKVYILLINLGSHQSMADRKGKSISDLSGLGIKYIP